jgi:hypothetical protein
MTFFFSLHGLLSTYSSKSIQITVHTVHMYMLHASYHRNVLAARSRRIVLDAAAVSRLFLRIAGGRGGDFDFCPGRVEDCMHALVCSEDLWEIWTTSCCARDAVSVSSFFLQSFIHSWRW